MALWWLQGFDEDHKGGFCDHSVRHRLQSVLKWLHGLTEDHQGSLLGLAWVKKWLLYLLCKVYDTQSAVMLHW